MIEFEVGSHQYRAGKLDAFQQLHLSRKIAPLLPKLLPTIVQLAAARGEEDENDTPLDLPALAASVGPLTETLAQMNDADVEYIFNTCLSVVSRQQQPSGWAPVWNKPSHSPMFEDLELPDLLQIVVKVVGDNLGPFMRGLPGQLRPSSPQPAQ